MHVEHVVEIARTPEEVFAFLAQHSNHVQLVEENISCEQISPGPPGRGARLKNVAKVFGRVMVEYFDVTEFEPPRVLAKASGEGSSFETSDRFELAPSAAGTRVSFTVTASPRNPLERVVIALMQRVVRRSMRRTLSKLKAVLESGAAPVRAQAAGA